MPVAFSQPRITLTQFLVLSVAVATGFTVNGSLALPLLVLAALLACSRSGRTLLDDLRPVGRRIWFACLLAGVLALCGQALGAGVRLELPGIGGHLALWIA